MPSSRQSFQALKFTTCRFDKIEQTVLYLQFLFDFIEPTGFKIISVRGHPDLHLPTHLSPEV